MKQVVVAALMVVVIGGMAAAQEPADRILTERRPGEDVTSYRLRSLETTVTKIETRQGDIKDRLVCLESSLVNIKEGISDIKISLKDAITKQDDTLSIDDILKYALLGLLGLGGGGLIGARRAKSKCNDTEEK